MDGPRAEALAHPVTIAPRIEQPPPIRISSIGETAKAMGRIGRTVRTAGGLQPVMAETALSFLATGDLNLQTVSRQVDYWNRQSHNGEGHVTDPRKAALAIDLQLSVIQLQQQQIQSQLEIAINSRNVSAVTQLKVEQQKLALKAGELNAKRLSPELKTEPNQFVELAEACGIDPAEAQKEPLVGVFNTMKAAMADSKSREALMTTLKNSDKFKDDADGQKMLTELENYMKGVQTEKKIDKVASTVSKVSVMGGLVLFLMMYLESQKSKSQRGH